MKRILIIAIVLLFSLLDVWAQTTPPGIIINHCFASSGKYLGSPSICIMPDGKYIVSHDYFGPQSTEKDAAVTDIFVSEDKGLNWTRISSLKGQFWSTVFTLKNSLYIFGTYRAHGNIVIRKSDDGGLTWTTPYDGRHGLLFEGEYHTAPVPVIEYRGRIWKAFEYATAKEPVWPERYSAIVLSASRNSDLLDSRNWRKSEMLASFRPQLNANFRGWLEGNIVYDKQQNCLVDILRVHAPKVNEEYCAKVRISCGGRKLKFTKEKDILPFPGGSKKFTIRYDEKTGHYWTLSNVSDANNLKGIQNDRVRNKLALCSSEDLIHWEVRKIIIENEDCLKHGFQYADWQFDGNDIVAVIRTAFEDEEGEADNYHNSNYIIFKRIENYNNQ